MLMAIFSRKIMHVIRSNQSPLLYLINLTHTNWLLSAIFLVLCSVYVACRSELYSPPELHGEGTFVSANGVRTPLNINNQMSRRLH
jgi:hypothetical protein